ncbi:MAG: hypothetical protein IKZ44_07010 [Clostridia bacterium]|nr:hypothetical protein [Clostridia bacterium]
MLFQPNWEMYDAFFDVASERAVSNIIAVLYLILGLAFVILYKKDSIRRKDVLRIKKTSRKEIADVTKQKDAEIAEANRQKSMWSQKWFETNLLLTITQDQLDRSRRDVSWEQYKNAQLLKGVVVNDADRAEIEAAIDAGSSVISRRNERLPAPSDP